MDHLHADFGKSVRKSFVFELLLVVGFAAIPSGSSDISRTADCALVVQ